MSLVTFKKKLNYFEKQDEQGKQRMCFFILKNTENTENMVYLLLVLEIYFCFEKQGKQEKHIRFPMFFFLF